MPRENGVIAPFCRGTATLSSVRTDDLDARFPGLLDSLPGGADLQAERLRQVWRVPAVARQGTYISLTRERRGEMLEP